MFKTLAKCVNCGVPYIECLSKGETIVYQKSYSNVNWNNESANETYWDWYCCNCLKDMSINCSHCDKQIEGVLPDQLDDGSFLCEGCDTKLNEELDLLCLAK